MPPLPNVRLSWGPMLIGVFFNLILYGVFVSQALSYYQRYRADDAWLRFFVGYLFVLETLNTGFDMGMMYQPLILQYGQKLDYFPTVFVSQPLFVTLVSTPIQLFFAWRIWTITRVAWVPVVVGVLAVVAFAGGLWTSIKVGLIKQFIHKPELHAPALVWFMASGAADVIITAALVFTLTNRKTGFGATDSVIDKIIRTTIQTGLVTSIFAILDVICFMVFPHLAINFIWDLPLSKLYSNALLSTLNAREELSSISTTRSGSRDRHSQSHLHGGRHSIGLGEARVPGQGWAGTDTRMTQLVFEDMGALGLGVGGETKFEEAEMEIEYEGEAEYDHEGVGVGEGETKTKTGGGGLEIVEMARSSSTARSTGTMDSSSGASTA
ncbi:hypothetical protein C8R45DRAFT_532599 [Mycena sanguinolenta]|nr:hypothetical protein C8R45DRAFT_532599 [Mycena sanguinolenta]